MNGFYMDLNPKAKQNTSLKIWLDTRTIKYMQLQLF